MICKENEDSLFVYRKLIEAFNACERQAAPYLNLVAIFFHDLMKILTGYVVMESELSGPYKPPTNKMLPSPKAFPYIGYEDVLNGIHADHKNYKPWQSSWPIVKLKLVGYKKTLENYFYSLKFRSKKKTQKLWVGFSGLSVESLLQVLSESRLKMNYRTPSRIDIPNREEQMKILQQIILETWGLLGLPDVDIMTTLVTRHILARSRSSCVSKRPPFDLILVGTLLYHEYRFMAALGRFHHIPVISVGHGEFDGALNEPAWGYGNYTFPTTFIGYGRAGLQAIKEENYCVPLYPLSEYITTNSGEVCKWHHDSRIETLESFEGKHLMYIPSQFYGQERYGPFHVLPDFLYHAWQNILFGEFPELILKRHPKERIRKDLYPENVQYVMEGYFENCVSKADVFVFDVFSGAMAVAMATSKPVIYFHIGMRNFSVAGREAIRKRCLWIDVDLNNPSGLHERVEAEIKKQEEKKNNFSKDFSLDPINFYFTREDKILETVLRVSN